MNVYFQTQVCVLQTTMDLLEKNYTVHVLADGVSSRTMVERMFALEVIQDMYIWKLYSIRFIGKGGGGCVQEMKPCIFKS